MTVGVASSNRRIVDEEVLAADVAVAQNVESANNDEGEGARSPLVSVHKFGHIPHCLDFRACNYCNHKGAITHSG
ncbi:MAG: hypothetical protein F6K25_13695 [Okeania sp. SIO2G4]|uniref:hypothetical protein n=1 Tax=unclassified Okeania TaxID=2634635 RepID=UPI0013BD201C|nr:MULTISPECIES: hypothetical protein [unclassified Okeania]NEP44293.1 hypothetical protein [Okeania sp. SIO2H7]NEP70965.1 hypothetical protein [Okeania sp. SIO2G5]NEP93818.1 hypothetical protein [Okeania sp. SIO2F5]NEQ91694.1 hypothetical protein [Okeania sp. SIO2G4]